ncbi:hypothetical protein CDAR_400771 [Caerostris darwini]|uniref:Uncharacterized protein n=1 Tax=Caerostris darwini TaxID=1538125 RepID=A0AAV4NA37_9ARAC|nr:hypothetical protein CDAR_400771 [Caerostris darwini]
MAQTLVLYCRQLNTSQGPNYHPYAAPNYVQIKKKLLLLEVPLSVEPVVYCYSIFNKAHSLSLEFEELNLRSVSLAAPSGDDELHFRIIGSEIMVV